jgi:DNA-binding protein HU-beta
MAMNKDDFEKELSRVEKVSLGEAKKWTDAVLNSIMRATKNKGGVKFVGFGTFENVKTKARVGRNPQTGGKINIPENRKPKFAPGKTFSDSIGIKNAKATPVVDEAAATSEKPANKPPKAQNKPA